MNLLYKTIVPVVIVALSIALLQPYFRVLVVVGVFRKDTPTKAQKVIAIADTYHCEDLHYHSPSHTLFTACEDHEDHRFSWFPPLATFEEPPQSRGSIHVVNPKTMKSTRLHLQGFSGLFVTHGIEIIDDPDREDSIYIFAVNHLPNPEFWKGRSSAHKARSQIEIFHHVLGTQTAQHVRSIRHPLITTPNDVYAESPYSIYVTNDHFYREGPWRFLEDLLPFAKWSNAIHIQLSDLWGKHAEEAVSAKIALTGIHNNNGLGRGSSSDILVTSAASGILYRARSIETTDGKSLSIEEEIYLDSTIDNPFYFSDPYRNASHDASGFIVPGLSRAVDLLDTVTDKSATDGVLIWYVKCVGEISSGTKNCPEYNARILFEDDGSTIRTASASVLIPIKPDIEGGKRKAWLFVAGVLADNIIAVEVDL